MNSVGVLSKRLLAKNGVTGVRRSESRLEVMAKPSFSSSRLGSSVIGCCGRWGLAAVRTRELRALHWSVGSSERAGCKLPLGGIRERWRAVYGSPVDIAWTLVESYSVFRLSNPPLGLHSFTRAKRGKLDVRVDFSWNASWLYVRWDVSGPVQGHRQFGSEVFSPGFRG